MKTTGVWASTVQYNKERQSNDDSFLAAAANHYLNNERFNYKIWCVI